MQSSDRRRGYNTIGEVVQRDYFKITALEDCEVGIDGGVNSSGLINIIYYSKNNGVTWRSIDLTSYTEALRNVRLKAGQSICFKANCDWGSNGVSGSYRRWFTSTGNVNISGNLMSLAWGDNFEGKTSMPPKEENTDFQCFSELFSQLKVVSAQDLVLPNFVVPNMYYLLFRNCTSLKYAPQILPATNLTPAENSYSGCYGSMFSGCTSLETAPALPATTLSRDCYSGMFQGCTSLTTAPELPALYLKPNCYNNMFNGCTRLNYIKAMFTYMQTQGYTIQEGIKDWVKGVAANGTFVKNSAAAWNLTGDSGIPTRWTVQTASE